MPYLPHTDEDVRQMLDSIGVASVEALLDSIPEAVRLKGDLPVPPALSEPEVLRLLEELSLRNRRADTRPCFLGAGMYMGHVPPAVDDLSRRGEFLTSYTPYQPEASQGTLQAIFEYQTMITRLTGMEVANASLYDGPTALAEAALMAHGINKRRRLLVSAGIHPESTAVLHGYLRALPIEIVEVPMRQGRTDPDDVKALADSGTIGFAFQSPNILGIIEEGEEIARPVRASGGIVIASVDPISLGILRPPGETGADVAVGDGQPLGNHPQFGGPSFGFLATRKEHVRRMPGRIVGETRDEDGRRCYVLTFQTREQHIRRERATSNICTNQGLCALRAAIYLSLLGETGLRAVAERSLRTAHTLAERIAAVEGFTLPHPAAPFFREFAVEGPAAASDVARYLRDEAGILPGWDLGALRPEWSRWMLLAVTEVTTADDVERLVRALEAFSKKVRGR